MTKRRELGYTNVAPTPAFSILRRCRRNFSGGATSIGSTGSRSDLNERQRTERRPIWLRLSCVPSFAFLSSVQTPMLIGDNQGSPFGAEHAAPLARVGRKEP